MTAVQDDHGAVRAVELGDGVAALDVPWVAGNRDDVVEDEPGMRRVPAEQVLGERARRGVVKRGGPGEIAEVAGYILRRSDDPLGGPGRVHRRPGRPAVRVGPRGQCPVWRSCRPDTSGRSVSERLDDQVCGLAAAEVLLAGDEVAVADGGG